MYSDSFFSFNCYVQHHYKLCYTCKIGSKILKTGVMLLSSCWKHYSILLHLEDRKFSQHYKELLEQYLSGINICIQSLGFVIILKNTNALLLVWHWYMYNVLWVSGCIFIFNKEVIIDVVLVLFGSLCVCVF